MEQWVDRAGSPHNTAFTRYYSGLRTSLVQTKLADAVAPFRILVNLAYRHLCKSAFQHFDLKVH
jgi:hypothetical protein